MLTFYTNRKALIPENRKRVFPLLFDVFYLKNPKAICNFYFEDEPEKADVHIFPLELSSLYSLGKSKEWLLFLDKAKELNKIVWVYAGGDFGITLPFDQNIHAFRLGGFDTKLDQNTHVMPSFINDPIIVFEIKWYVLEKNNKPSVGFVGHSNGSFSKMIKEFLIYDKQQIKRMFGFDKTDFQSFFPSSRKRFQLLEKLRKSDEVDTDFIYRKKYRAGVKNENEVKETTLEFYRNIASNLYTFCMRGSGNFSVRFYETLIMGRIPVVVDTDFRLPLHDLIDWSKHCVIVKKETMIVDLLNFHNSKSKDEIYEIQKSNRELMLNHLNRVDYFISIKNNIK